MARLPHLQAKRARTVYVVELVVATRQVLNKPQRGYCNRLHRTL